MNGWLVLTPLPATPVDCGRRVALVCLMKNMAGEIAANLATANPPGKVVAFTVNAGQKLYIPTPATWCWQHSRTMVLLLACAAAHRLPARCRTVRQTCVSGMLASVVRVRGAWRCMDALGARRRLLTSCQRRVWCVVARHRVRGRGCGPTALGAGAASCATMAGLWREACHAECADVRHGIGVGGYTVRAD